MYRTRVMSLLKAFLIGWVFPMVWSSSLEAPRRRPLPARSDSIEPMDDDQNDSFKDDDDWWKDPFAMFDESEDEYDVESDSSFPSFDLEEEEEDFSESTVEETSENEKTIQSESNNPQTLMNEETPESDSAIEGEKGEGSKSDSADDLRTTSNDENERSETRTKLLSGSTLGSQSSSSAISSVVTIPPQNLALRNPTSPAALALLLTAIPKVRIVVSAFPFFKIFCLFGLIRMAQPIFERGSVPRTKRNRDYGSTEEVYHQEQEIDDNIKLASKRPIRWLMRFAPGIGNSSKERLPPARELHSQVEELRIELATVKSEKEGMEREYEKTSWSLQETQNELTNLQSSSQYLKAQLRDNQEVMEKAIRAERRKAREELARMKEAMLQILQRERKEFRQKITKQKQDSQSTTRQKNTGNGN